MPTPTITTDVTIYVDTKIQEARHLAFDSVADYLTGAHVASSKISNVMLERRAFDMLDVDINLALNAADYLAANYSSNRIDYAKIELTETGSTALVYYYFVKSVEWRSVGACKLHCRLDVLATFPLHETANASKRGILLHEHTVTHRKHKARFQDYDSDNLRAIRLVDKYDEGLQPVLYQRRGVLLLDANEPDPDDGLVQWNLVYRNKDVPSSEYQDNPVECHLTTDENASVNLAGVANEISSACLTSGDGYDYAIDMNDLTEYTTQFVFGATTVTVDTNLGSQFYGFRKNPDGTVSLLRYRWQPGYPWEILQVYAASDFIEIIDAPNSSLHCFPNWLPQTGNPDSKTYDYVIQLDSTLVSIKGIHGSYDRTSQKLIKICKVPYAPVAITYDEDAGAFSVPTGWSLDLSANDLKQDDINKRFKRLLALVPESGAANPFIDNLIVTWASAGVLPAKGQTRDKKYESKLKNSSFHPCKFAYDSFCLPIMWECAKDGLLYADFGFPAGIQANYVVSTTFSGSFAFDFVEAATLFAGGETQDYPHRLAVTRNNQEPIFNSAYLNYVRTGYNYDVKAKNQQLVGSAIGIGASVAGGLAAAAMMSNPYTAIIGAGVGVAASILSAVNSQINSENQIQQKLQSARMQAVTISASDDVDLLVDYSGNRLKYIEYDPSEAVSDALFNLFYYCGYACNDMGVPDIHSRVYFDYLQADAELEAMNANIPNVFLDEARTRISEGITVIHKPMADLGLLDCAYENWEKTLFGL